MELCVVGDDDQAIYQWRGSDVANIVGFRDRYPDVATFEITANRRSRPQIVDAANAFATTIAGRLPKTMAHSRPAAGPEADLVVWYDGSEVDEAGWIADFILRFNENGVAFRDMAVLVRSRAAYARLVASRFPTSRTGRPQDWLVPRDQLAAGRYEGAAADERRLFYVALTRARDWVSVSRHERVTKNRAGISPFWQELAALPVDPATIVLPPIEPAGPASDASDGSIDVTYSELAAFLDCGMAYRLRNLVGFQPRLAPELGYGKAVHHVLRTVAEQTKADGRIPVPAEIDDKVTHRELKEAARRLVTTYTTDQELGADLYRVWETERPFELHLDGIVVAGRADVILDREGGVATGLAIVDYKTSTGGDIDDHSLQLQVYADAGRREQLDVRGAYVHDLRAARRDPVDVSPTAMAAAETTITEAADRLRAREYRPNPGRRCRACDVRTICPAATA